MDGFNQLPFPMQVMELRRMQEAQQARQRAGGILYGAFPQQQPQPQVAPPPPQMQPSAQPAPQPGSMSPGGGNPMVQGGGSVMAPQPQRPPTPQMTGAMGGMQVSPQPIPPFRPLPQAAPQQAGAGGIPPPPAPAPPEQAKPPSHIDIRQIIQQMQKAGVPPEQAAAQLEQLMPVIQAAQQDELRFFQAQTKAQAAAIQAFRATIAATLGQQNMDVKRADVERKTTQGETRIDQGQQKIDLAKQKLGQQAGGEGNIKKWEYDKADATKVVGGWTKTGKHIKLDEPGMAVSGRPGGGGQAAAVRSNLVKGSAANTLRMLDEVEKKFPGATTSSYFGYHADNPLTKGAAAGAKSITMSQKDRQIDALWAGIIEEVGPVLSGGLRNSDAFRRFLIDQAPALGDDKATVTKKIKILRDNVSGTSHAFFDKFASDPSMWGAGVTKEQVEAARGGGESGAGQGEWKVEKLN